MTVVILQELTEAENAINKLIKTLDDRKEACLTRTFTEVKYAFQKVFQELVPGGRGDMHKEGSGVKVPTPPDLQQSAEAPL